MITKPKLPPAQKRFAPHILKSHSKTKAAKAYVRSKHRVITEKHTNKYTDVEMHQLRLACEKVTGEDLIEAIEVLGASLINEIKLPIAQMPLDEQQSKFFKKVYSQPARNKKINNET